MTARVNIGLLGYGGIGRVHSMSYRQLPFIYPQSPATPVLHTVCTSRAETADAAKAEAGFLRAVTDSDALIADPDIQAVDVTLPNHLHLPAVRAALKAGKHVYCEKPLAGKIEDARKIASTVQSAAGFFGMVFQYRYIPALMKARELMQDGKLGHIFTYRAEYLHSGYQDPTRPLSWRMKKEEGGSGALGDLGLHVIDLIRYLIGEFDSLQGHLETFIHERPVSKGAAETGEVTVDDVAWFRARMQNGAVGTVEASRFATGTLDDLRIWIYGERGALRFDLMDANFLYWFDESHLSGQYGGNRGWQRLDTVANYPGAKTPPARAPLGWARAHAENQQRFLSSVVRGEEPSPGIVDGLRAQLVMDAVERSAATDGAWTTVEQE
jgi:levoglucosan dehydrogenase